jgi:hypothetical protein
VISSLPPLRSAASSNTSYAAANGLQVEVKGTPGQYISAPISLLPQSYPSNAFERAILLGWGWRALERRGGGVCIVRTAGEDSPPDFNRRLPPSQTTARGRGAGFGSFTPRGKIRHPPPHTHTSLLVPCPPPFQNVEAVEVVKDEKRRLEYRARREAADENITINHGC